MVSLNTSRLSLVPMLPELLRAEQVSYVNLSEALGAVIAEDWPPENWEPHVFGFIERQYANDPSTLGWNRYVLLRREGDRPVLVGTSGGFRRGEAEAELGYSIVPSFQRCGYTSEAVAALMTWLFEEAGVRTISAQTFPHLIGSVGVMVRCGMHPVGDGDEPGTVRYQRVLKELNEKGCGVPGSSRPATRMGRRTQSHA